MLNSSLKHKSTKFFFPKQSKLIFACIINALLFVSSQCIYDGLVPIAYKTLIQTQTLYMPLI